MNKFFLSVCLCFISLTVGCDYFVEKKPSKKEKLEFAEKCNKAGKAYVDEFISKNLHSGFLWDEPEYHYSSKLNTCLIHIRYVSFGTSSIHRNQVIDIFTNKTIMYGWFERNTEKNTETLSETFNHDVPNYKSIEYFKRKELLFSE